MEDINIGCKPYKKGDKLIIEVTVTDEDLSFDYLGKCLYRDKDTSDIGLKIESVAFHKERYKDNIPLELRSEILNKFNKTFDEIEGMLLKK
jgi:hypothetical protein